MNEFLKKIMVLGAELDKTEDKFQISMIINDAEKLYEKEMLEHNVYKERDLFGELRSMGLSSDQCQEVSEWVKTIKK